MKLYSVTVINHVLLSIMMLNEILFLSAKVVSSAVVVVVSSVMFLSAFN